MTNSPCGDKYSFDAAVALYDLEPDLRDVVVEGHGDVSFLNWYLEPYCKDVRVFDVDSRFDVPSEMVSELGLTPSKRNRAIALAAAVSRVCGPNQRAFTAFVDSDYGATLGPLPIERDCLIFTDLPSVECYALQDRPLNKFLRLGAQVNSRYTARMVRDAILPALTEVYAVRAVLAVIDVPIIIKFINDCNLHPTKSTADIDSLLRKSAGRDLNAIGLIDSTPGDYARELVKWFTVNDIYCRGHDIAVAMFKYLNLRAKYKDAEAVERSMMTSLEHIDLDGHPSFENLRIRVC